jgi:uncharacterized protein (DUF1684 family)
MTALDEYRRRKDEFFKRSPDSPLQDDALAAFTGLRYFPENPALRLTVAIEEFTDKEDVWLQTSTGEPRHMRRWGRFRFDVDGQAAELTVYSSSAGDFFVPFKDATSGTETYGAGRYLEIEETSGGRFLVDFNLAYNPWCAYSPYYSCPIPPVENRLTVPIRAGELDFDSEPD